jgi:hypothetical protein
MAPPSAKNFNKNYPHVCVFYSLVCVSYSLIFIFLFTCLYSCKALLNLILAPTCKTDYLVLICCFHRKLKFKEFSRNTIDLHFLKYFSLFINYCKSTDFNKWLCKIQYTPVCQFGPCSNKKSCFIWSWSISRFCWAHLELGI